MDRTVLIDGRWVGIGGPGRVAELLLGGLGLERPPGRWLIWGPEKLDEYLWPGAELVPSRHHAKAWYSQRDFPGPRGRADVAYYPHQLRPAWRLAPVEITTIHDTIPFRYPPNAVSGVALRAHFRWMARLSTMIVTDSEFSKRSIEADLRVAPNRVRVLSLPIDHESAARVRAIRLAGSAADRAVFVGRDAPHKNLDRLVRAFARTEANRRGGRLLLVGVDGPSVRRLETLAGAEGVHLDLAGVVGQDELERLLAGSAVLVQPSTEEGFGLPVAEAMAAGMPVAVSSGGSLPEITRGLVEPFDPLDIDAIAGAIDTAFASDATSQIEWPGPAEFARSALAAIDAACSMR